jgi:hypothetical protein
MMSVGKDACVSLSWMVTMCTLISRLFCGCILLLTLSASASASDLALLSNNIKPGESNETFPPGTVIQATEMTTQWVTQGEFATDEESVKTGTANGKQMLFDGNAGSNWKSRTYSKWGGGKWVTLIVDLGAPYALGAFDVWALHEETRDTESFQILLSDDGRDFTPHGLANCPDLPLAKNSFVRLHKTLESPVKARYVQLRIQRKSSAKQQQIAEIAIWGNTPRQGTSYLESDSRPKVAFTVQTIQSGVARIDWSQSSRLDAHVKQWKVYQSSKAIDSVNGSNATLLKTVAADQAHVNIYPLKAGQTVYFAVSAVYDQGEYPLVNSVAVRIPMPLECHTFKDMMAINHFWGGGAHRVPHADNQDAYERIAVDLLADLGVTQVRWWKVDAAIFERYYNRGIGIYAYPQGENLQAATQLGVNVFAGAKNEPDLSTMPIDVYIKRLAEFYQAMKTINPDAIMGAPSSCTEDKSLQWLESFYQQGGKPHFDVLDLHTYTKIADGHQVPDGYPAGAPEALYDNLRKVRSILGKHGDQDKPIISTEFGYSDAPVNNPSGNVSLATQAEYLVRGLVIHHALGFRRVFIYSFWDEGTDRNFTEHRFGLIDHDLQKKPAFYAVKTLVDQLGDYRLKGKMDGVSLPSIGYQYEHPTEGKLVHVLWDGAQDRAGVFQTKAKSVVRVDMLGQRTELAPDAEGRFTTPFGHAPIYLHADQPITLIGSKLAEARPSSP